MGGGGGGGGGKNRRAAARARDISSLLGHAQAFPNASFDDRPRETNDSVLQGRHGWGEETTSDEEGWGSDQEIKGEEDIEAKKDAHKTREERT